MPNPTIQDAVKVLAAELQRLGMSPDTARDYAADHEKRLLLDGAGGLHVVQLNGVLMDVRDANDPINTLARRIYATASKRDRNGGGPTEEEKAAVRARNPGMYSS